MLTNQAGSQYFSISHGIHERKKILFKWVLFLSVFFRGFRGHNIHHYQIETVLEILGNGTPKVDIIDRDTEIAVRAELPGVMKEDLDVTVSADWMTLKAHTSHEEKEVKGVYYRREMSYGEYQRAVALLHTVNGENAGATFKDGVLELTLPKLERTSRN
jgi:HSP20 family molecular chaperone IbpA